MSRTPFAEPLVQVLLFGGLCLFIDSFGVLGGGLALAGLGGLALGLTVLVWIGSLSILLPVFPVLALLFVRRRRQAGPLGIGLFLGIAIGLAAGLVLARSYLSTLSTELHLFGLCAAGFGAVDGADRAAGVPRRARLGAAGVRSGGRAWWGWGVKRSRCRPWRWWRSGWLWRFRWPRSSGWPSGRTCRPPAGRPTRP